MEIQPGSVAETQLPTQEQLNDPTLQAQAFEINSQIFTTENPLPVINKEKSEYDIVDFFKEYKLKRINKKLKLLEHASRYFKGQPHEDSLALSGIEIAIETTEKRAKNIKDDPDDAAAAINDGYLLFVAYNKLYDKLYTGPDVDIFNNGPAPIRRQQWFK